MLPRFIRRFIIVHQLVRRIEMSAQTDAATAAANAIADLAGKAIAKIHDQNNALAAKDAQIADLQAKVASHAADDAATQAVAEQLHVAGDALAAAVQ